MSIIDFNRARLTWTTRTGIQGTWRLIASARRSTELDDQGGFFLAPLVMAGDVFGSERLPLDPPYSFQLVASSERHVMLRETTRGARREDSVAESSDIFSKLSIHAPLLAAARIEMSTLTPDKIQELWPLAASATISGPDGEAWRLEFPVNHINSKRTAGESAFQIETGPVLIPERLIQIPGASTSGGFMLAYVFCNRADRIDLLVWGWADGQPNNARAYRHFARLEHVGIELYVVSDP